MAGSSWECYGFMTIQLLPLTYRLHIGMIVHELATGGQIG